LRVSLLISIIKTYNSSAFVIHTLVYLRSINLKDSFFSLKYDKQDQQGKGTFNERNPRMTQQQEPVARSPGEPITINPITYMS
jgi:hypothetical protein